MYMDIDRWRTLINKFAKHSSPKEYGMYINIRKQKKRGGVKRK